MRNTSDLTPLELFARIISPDGVRRLAAKHGWKFRWRLYPPTMVLWLMINQRLQGPGTLAQAVGQVCQKRTPLGRLLGGGPGRSPARQPSSHTGGFSRARQRLPVAMSRDLLEELTRRLQENYLGQPEGSRRVYLIDGSSLQLQERGDFLERYPPARNQHGRSHWPVLRIAVLQDAYTGLAGQPAWGPMYGSGAVSEQALAEDLIEQMPPGSVLVGDPNFGVFSVAFHAVSRQQAVVLRLTRARALKIAGSALRPGLDQAVEWCPSAWDRQQHPQIAAGASLTGRLLVCAVPGWREPLYLFTTLTELPAEVLRVYQLRWNVETDLRALKQAARLHRLTAKSETMLEKELLLAVVAYNLVRAIICLAAHQAGIHPRELSFTHTLYHLNACLPDLLTGWPSMRSRRQLQHLIRTVTGCRLPQRHRRRSYPRAVWSRGYKYPVRQENDDA